jgi:hypothetical protein
MLEQTIALLFYYLIFPSISIFAFFSLRLINFVLEDLWLPFDEIIESDLLIFNFIILTT